MKTLTDLEYKEFEKTFDFIDNYIGCAVHYGAKSIYNIKFDNKVVNEELILFVNDCSKLGFINIEDKEENKNIFNKYSPLHKINALFNSHTTKHKRNTIQRLIRWCYKNKIQPHRLRVLNFKEYIVQTAISKQDEVIIYEFEN